MKLKFVLPALGALVIFIAILFLTEGSKENFAYVTYKEFLEARKFTELQETIPSSAKNIKIYRHSGAQSDSICAFSNVRFSFESDKNFSSNEEIDLPECSSIKDISWWPVGLSKCNKLIVKKNGEKVKIGTITYSSVGYEDRTYFWNDTIRDPRCN